VGISRANTALYTWQIAAPVCDRSAADPRECGAPETRWVAPEKAHERDSGPTHRGPRGHVARFGTRKAGPGTGAGSRTSRLETRVTDCWGRPRGRFGAVLGRRGCADSPTEARVGIGTSVVRGVGQIRPVAGQKRAIGFGRQVRMPWFSPSCGYERAGTEVAACRQPCLDGPRREETHSARTVRAQALDNRRGQSRYRMSPSRRARGCA
jgi:hypothetical protein